MQKTNKTKSITLNQLDKTPIGEIITYPAKELFRIQEEARREFDKSLMRKKWIEGVIELKYKTTINDLVKNAEDTLKTNPEAQEDFNLNNKHEEFIRDGEDCIKVEFYRGLSDIFQRPTTKARFSLVNPTAQSNQNTEA